MFGKRAGFIVLFLVLLSIASFAVENRTRLVVSIEGKYAVAKLYLEKENREAVEGLGTVAGGATASSGSIVPATAFPSNEVFSLELLPDETVVFKTQVYDAPNNKWNEQTISSCSAVTTGRIVGEDLGVAKCDVSGIPSPVPGGLPGFGMQCVQIVANYTGNPNIGKEYAKADSNGVSKCTGVIALPLQTLLDEKCLPIYLILGLLAAAMYVQGRNPLGLFDITTPKLPKPKKYHFHKMRRPLSWNQAYYAFAMAGASYKSRFNQVLEGVTNKMKIAGVDSAEIDKTLRLTNRHEQTVNLRRLFEKWNAAGERNKRTVADLQRSLNALANFEQIFRIHSQSERDVINIVGVHPRVYEPIPTLRGTSAGVRMVNFAIRGANSLVGRPAGTALEGLFSAGKVAKLTALATRGAVTGATLAVAKKVAPGMSGKLGQKLEGWAGSFARIPGQRVMNSDRELKQSFDRAAEDLQVWALARLERSAEATRGVDRESLKKKLLDQIKTELKKIKKELKIGSSDYAARMAIMIGSGPGGWSRTSTDRTVFEEATRLKQAVDADVQAGGSMTSAANQDRFARLVKLIEVHKVQAKPTTSREAVERAVDRRMHEFRGQIESATDLDDLRNEVRKKIMSEGDEGHALKYYKLDEHGAIVPSNINDPDSFILREGLAKQLTTFDGKERLSQIQLEEWKNIYSDAVYKRELEAALASGVSRERAEDITLLRSRNASNELSSRLAREHETPKQVEIARSEAIGFAVDGDQRVAEAVKKWAEDSAIQGLADKMNLMGMPSAGEAIEKFRMDAACGGELDSIMADFNANKGIKLVEVGQSVLGEDLTALEGRIIAYNGASEAGKQAMMDGGLRDDLNALTRRITNADEASKTQIAELATEKGLDEVNRRSTRDLIDSLRSLGYERDLQAKVPNLRNGDLKLDEANLMRPGGEVTYEMTQAGAWLAQPNGVWAPIPINNPEGLAHLKIGNADVPTNVDMYLVTRGKQEYMRPEDGGLPIAGTSSGPCLERFNKEDTNFLRTIQVPGLDRNGNPTGRMVDAVESGVIPELKPDGTPTGRMVPASGQLKWRELLAAKYFAQKMFDRKTKQVTSERVDARPLVFKQKNKDFADAALRSLSVREVPGNPVFDAWAKGEHKALRPVLRGFEGALLGASEKYIRAQLDAKSTLEASSQAPREFDKRFETGQYSARMGDLNADSNKKAYIDAFDNVLQAHANYEEVRCGRDAARVAEADRRLTDARSELQRIVSERGDDGIMKLGYRTRQTAMTDIRYKSETNLRQSQAERAYFEEQRRNAEKKLAHAERDFTAARARGDFTEANRLQSDVNRYRLETNQANARLTNINADIQKFERRLRFDGVVGREMREARRELDGYVGRTKAEAEAFDYPLSDAQSWMHQVADLRFPLIFKTVRAANASYGTNMYIPGPYPFGPHMYMPPLDALRGKIAWGAGWGLMLSPEHKFGQSFTRMVRAPIMHVQGVPMLYEPLTGYKQDRGMLNVAKSFFKTGLPYSVKDIPIVGRLVPHGRAAVMPKPFRGVMPGEEYNPKYGSMKSLKETQGILWARTPAGRSPLAVSEMYDRYGFALFLSKYMHDTRGIMDETLQDYLLQDNLSGMSPEQARDLGLRQSGGYSPGNRISMWVDSRSPIKWRLGAMIARNLVQTRPHLATPAVREAAQMDLYFRRKTVAQHVADLDFEYRILRPWETPGFTPALPPVAAYKIGSWLKAHTRSITESIKTRRQRDKEDGLLGARPAWERKMTAIQTGLDALGVVAPGAAAAMAFAAGPAAAVGVAYAPNVIAKWWDKTRANRKYRNGFAYGHLRYCTHCTRTFEQHVPGAPCTHCHTPPAPGAAA